MADPISVVGLVIAIGQVAQILLSNSLDVQHAMKECKDLRTELLGGLIALKGVLEEIQSQGEQGADVGRYDSKEFLDMCNATYSIVVSLRVSLEQAPSKVRQSIQRVKWIWKKDDVRAQLDRIERYKSWFLLMASMGEWAQLRELLSQVRHLTIDTDEEKQARRGEYRNGLLKWLAPASPDEAQLKAAESHQAGTSQWFLEGPLQTLQQQDAGQSNWLWLKGKSGSGKTIILAQAVESLLRERSPGVEILYFFCSFQDAATQDPANILCSFISQLSHRSPDILDDLKPFFDESMSRRRPRTIPLSLIEEILKGGVSKMSRVYVILDAVNESDQQNAILGALVRIATSTGNLQVLISSTGDCPSEIERSSPKNIDFTTASMQPHHVQEDVGMYLDATLQGTSQFSNFSPELKRDIKTTLLARSDGMFRYVSFQMDQLSRQCTGKNVRRALNSMPNSLNESYANILSKLPLGSPVRDLVRSALLWVTWSFRPMTLDELAEAVVIEDGDTDLDADSRLFDRAMLIRETNGLLDYNKQTELVSLSHSTVKAFLTSEWIKGTPLKDFATDETSGHHLLLKTCLAYLSFVPFRSGFTDQQPESSYALLPYATYFWAFHVRQPSIEAWEIVQAFLETKSQHHCGAYGRWIQQIYGYKNRHVIKHTHPLYFAASYGCLNLMELILKFDKSADLEAVGGQVNSTPLQVASFHKQKETTRSLVLHGADCFALDRSFDISGGCTPLFWAVENGWPDIAELMLKEAEKRGRKVPDAQSTYSKGAVEFARREQYRAVKGYKARLARESRSDRKGQKDA